MAEEQCLFRRCLGAPVCYFCLPEAVEAFLGEKQWGGLSGGTHTQMTRARCLRNNGES